MNRIQKFIRKLGNREAQRALDAVAQVRADQLAGLDVKKLKGEHNAYRVRLGRIRIKFLKTTAGNTVTDIEFRDDNTYS